MGDDSTATKNDLYGRWIVGILLLVFSVGYVEALLWRLLNTFPGKGLEATMVDPRQINEALIMLFAGGVGSLIYEIRGYILHSCYKKDFERAYIPWYIFWSVQGALLGFIFYFAVRGGVLLLTIGGETQSPANLNVWSLALVGSLVGLFSKYAIEKLRQVFVIIFTSKADLDQEEKENQIIADIQIAQLEEKLLKEEQKKLSTEIENKKKENDLAVLKKVNP